MDSHAVGAVRRCGMRRGIEIEVTGPDTKRLEAIVAARGSPQKHVWRARIILLTAQGLGTQAIMVATGKFKTCVWRWQERFMAKGGDGLLRNKTRPPGIAPLEAATDLPPVSPSIITRVLRLNTMAPAPAQARRA